MSRGRRMVRGGKNSNRDHPKSGITVPLMREKRSCISLLLVLAEFLFVSSQDWGKGQERKRGWGFLPLAVPGRGFSFPFTGLKIRACL